MRMAIKRGLIVLIGLGLQIILSLFVYLFLIEHIAIISSFYGIIGFILVLALIKNSKNYSYTLPWIIILIMFPLIGTLLYIILGKSKNKSKILKKITQSEKESKKYLIQNKDIKKEFKNNGKLNYLSEYAGYPVTTNNEVTYYPLGEILEEKAKKGVDVRVMYDDFGCVATLKKSYPKELQKKGIKCVVFNALNPIAGMIMNNRDHRKIMVIDGKVAFSGGINIADEYININSKYGHWKDNGIKIVGDAVWNYTVMFLGLWNAFKKEDKDFTKFKYDFKNRNINNGYVVPYGETPLDEEITGEDVYLNIINQANDYVYIFTPYLIIDTDMINSLNLAAKRGVDVRIVIPGIPDKKIVYTLSESHIEPLAKAGVKVYKYTPGFVHAKVFVSDDKIATVGTINLDYRSLYLHFECGCYMENVDVIKDIKKDMIETIEKSREVGKKEISPNFFKWVWQALLRLVAPLM